MLIFGNKHGSRHKTSYIYCCRKYTLIEFIGSIFLNGGRVFQSVIVNFLLVLGGVGILHLFFYLFESFQQKNKIPAQATPNVLRGPGQSLLKQIGETNEKLQRALIFIFIVPVVIFAVHLSYSTFGKVPESLTRIAISIGCGLAIIGYYSITFLRLRSIRGLLKMGYDGEVAVAHELNHMMTMGYQIYHDFPGDGFNIDHILIGPAGVMAVETKTLSSGTSRRRKADAVVTYDGRMLHFPKHSDHRSIDQAKQQAAWLSNWLSSTIGEEICARAMVALPGWFVKRTSADGIPVVNPKQFETLFKHIKPRPLSEDMIGRIVNQVEQHCSQTGPQSNSCYSFL